ncbi:MULTISPECIES: ACT domain-containing protein [unclassified Psychrobacillus]|uniref:ACT domain-containing protein n=1 Tax=unclassified Psychrobacillus TaxID=2636677 RepID=UPI00146EDA7C|nr:MULTISPECIES: ACT domain-containing protein [unclassified Psychrobacillus]MCM3358485.1 ACT domain-containing protein [Psychrobacillus sp. MER TA 171]NME06187.1 ACT domain-containing protein [Psychrobacillus sp. BL-248-WT-3]
MKDVTSQRFFLVREDVLTEAMQKTLEAKHLLQSRKVSSIWDAVKEVDLSRSAFYKYRDAVFPFHSIVQERILTVFLQLEDREGTLARLLSLVADYACNVLTIHQTIPIQGRASVTLSLDVTAMAKELDEFINEMKRLDFVESAEIISSGAF